MTRHSVPPMPKAMTGMAAMIEAAPAESRAAVLQRSTLIALIAFLTLIDLFGSQALLPQLVDHYGVSRAAMGFAVNASTLGMAAASLGVALLAARIDRRMGIWVSLALLSVPTFALAFAQDLTTFTALRILQGVFMATAFTLTLTYLSEICAVTAVGGAMAAYITGNVASNLFGRLLATEVAGSLGLSESFLAFGALNLTGAALAIWYMGWRDGTRDALPAGPVLQAWRAHFANAPLLNTFAIGFILLFVFVAAFSYANFVIDAQFDLPPMLLGLVYLVFAPSILTTPLAASAVAQLGPRRSFLGAMAATGAGLALLLVPSLVPFLAGLTFVAAGLFFGQSVATSYIGRTATADRAAANGLYLASYYLGGITGALVIGQVFDAMGWHASVAVLLALTGIAAALGRRMTRF